MRAALLRDTTGHLAIEDVTIDSPGRDEVLIQTVATGLCHSDFHFIDGSWRTPFPTLLGHEGAGIVLECGPDVVGFDVGDHVVSCLSVYCGHCERCLTGSLHLCPNRLRTANRRRDDRPRIVDTNGDAVTQFAGLGAFAEQMLVHQNAMVKIDPDMPLDRAALLGCGVLTGVGAVTKSAAVEAGSSVVVIGCGGVGTAALQGAHLAGARTIVAVDLASNKLEWAKKFGATHVVNPNDEDPVEAVKDITKGGADYTFECIGLKATAEQAFQMLRPGGLATVIGMIPFGVNLEISGADLFLNAKRLQGSFMGSNSFKVDLPRLCTLYMNDRLKLDEMMTQTIQLDDINAGFAAMKNGDVVRSTIAF